MTTEWVLAEAVTLLKARSAVDQALALGEAIQAGRLGHLAARHSSAVGQPGRFDTRDTDRFVLVAAAAAGPDRADHLAGRVLDHDGAGLWQELAL